MSTCPTTFEVDATIGGQAPKYKITFIGVNCVNNQQTWTYFVEELDGNQKDISDFAFELCDDPDHEVISTSTTDPVNSTFEPNLNSGNPCLTSIGINRQAKWDTQDAFSSGTFTFTLQGCFQKTTIKVAIKTGAPGPPPAGCFIGDICGPSCFPEPAPRPPRGTPFSEEEKVTAIF